MTQFSYIAIFLFGFLIAACQNGKEANKVSETAEATTTDVNEDSLINRLTQDLYSDPETQAEIDQNKIIHYALDSLLNVKRSDSGLYYWIVKEGEGEPPTPEHYVFVHYRGRFLDGQVFDSSYKRDKVAQFQLKNLIQGWQEAIGMLKPGGKGVFLVPSHLAYGEKGYPPLIPPNKVLRFDIELFDTYKPE